METRAERRVPLIVVAHQETAALVEWLRAEGAVVYQTRTPEGCLRVATAVRPDMIVLPRDFPRRLALLLRQHPTSAGAKIVWLQRPATTGDGRAADDAALVRETLRSVVDELARSAEQVAALAQALQPLQPANLTDENVVAECGSDPPPETAARPVTQGAHVCWALAGQPTPPYGASKRGVR